MAKAWVFIQSQNASTSPLARPAKIPHQIPPLLPREPPELPEIDRIGVYARIRFDTPPQVRAPPRPQPVAAGEAPKNAEHAYLKDADLDCCCTPFSVA
jgi:hypothetical protein